jgi:hypothetical protein
MTALAVVVYGGIIVWRYIIDRKAQRERDEILQRIEEIENKMR